MIVRDARYVIINMYELLNAFPGEQSVAFLSQNLGSMSSLVVKLEAMKDLEM